MREVGSSLPAVSGYSATMRGDIRAIGDRSPQRPRPVAVTGCALVRHAPKLELLAALKRAVEFDDYLGDHAPHHGLDRHDDSLRIEGFGYSCGKGLGEARGALPDDADDAATAGLGPALRARGGGRGGRGRPGW